MTGPSSTMLRGTLTVERNAIFREQMDVYHRIIAHQQLIVSQESDFYGRVNAHEGALIQARLDVDGTAEFTREAFFYSSLIVEGGAHFSADTVFDQGGNVIYFGFFGGSVGATFDIPARFWQTMTLSGNRTVANTDPDNGDALLWLNGEWRPGVHGTQYQYLDSSYIAQPSDDLIYQFGGGNTVTLPPLASVPNGKVLRIFASSSVQVELAGNDQLSFSTTLGEQYINGGPPVALLAGGPFQLVQLLVLKLAGWHLINEGAVLSASRGGETYTLIGKGA